VIRRVTVFAVDCGGRVTRSLVDEPTVTDEAFMASGCKDTVYVFDGWNSPPTIMIYPVVFRAMLVFEDVVNHVVSSAYKTVATLMYGDGVAVKSCIDVVDDVIVVSVLLSINRSTAVVDGNFGHNVPSSPMTSRL
jgi:hypothetical protein